MRTFKKDDRILQTNDNVIAEAIINSGYKEVETTPKNEEEKTETLEEVETTSKRRNKKGD